MPRLVKRKSTQGLPEDGADPAEVDALLQKQRLLLMSGKLPTLEPRMSATYDSQTDSEVVIAVPDEESPLSTVTSDVSKTTSVAKDKDVTVPSTDVVMSEVTDRSEGRDVHVSQINQRRTLQLDEQAAGVSGFKRQSSDGNRVGLDPARSGSRGPPVGARRALSDRLSGMGQRFEEHRGRTSGRFGNRLEEKEPSGSFTKMRILALNESSSDDSDLELEMESSKEAQEAEAYTLYNQALDLQRAGDSQEAESTYQQLLSIPLLTEVEPPEEDDELVNPGLMLKYSAYKNLASMAYQKEDLDTAMKHYLEAVKFDESDVTVWYRIGTIAVTLYQLPLARLGFIQALKCSPKHWPSLDKLCTVLYAINDYATCLFYICQALERDCNYEKGVVLREKMFQEQPSLRKDSYDLFRNCHDAIRISQVKKSEAERIMKEALTLREERRALARRPPMPLVKLLTPFPSFASFTWKGLGERLVALYDHLRTSSPPLGVCCKIDLSEFIQHPKDKEMEKDTDSNEQETMMDITHDTPTAKPQDTSVGEAQTTPFVTPTLSKPAPLEQDSKEDAKDPIEQSPLQNPCQTPGQTPEQTTQQTPQGTIQETPEQDTSQQTPHQTPSRTIQQISLHTQQQSPQQTAQQTHQQTSPPTSLHDPLPTPDQTPDQTPAQIQQHTQERSSDTEEPVAMETEPVPVKEKVRRGPKRKRDKGNNPLLGNRRSTRVRNTAVKKKEELVNYQELLRQFLPSSLQDSGDFEDGEEVQCPSERSDVTKKPSRASNKTETSDEVEQPASVDCDPQESESVWTFLEKRQRNSGILQVLHDFLLEVAKTLLGKWPSGLPSIFVQGFFRCRPHFILPSIFSSDYTNDFKTSYGLMLLAYAELKVDQLVSARNKTPSNSAKKADLESTGKHFDEDLFYIQMLTTSGALHETEWQDFTVRYYWLKARYMMLVGKSDDAVNAFGLCTDILNENQGTDQPDHAVFLPNCSVDNQITVDLVKDQLKSTQHCQSLEEIQRLWEAEQYVRVTELLLPTLQDSSSRREVMKEGATPQRPSQLLLFHRSLLKMNDYKQCVQYGAASISEALKEVIIAKTQPIREGWITVATELFIIINKALQGDINSLKQLNRPQRVCFTNAIIGVIELCMDSDWSVQGTSVLPWVVLYQVIKHEEDQIASKQISVTVEKQEESGRSRTPMIPSSLMLLDTAHEYLGRRSLCCNSNGAFLRLNISVLSREIAMGTEDDPHPFLSDLQYSLEQCFFCLHGHPSKKTKARHLQDHGVDELPMDLEDARIIFDYFKPSVLPEFDSYKTSSMSGDLESLLLKIVRIIPPMDDPPITMETLQSYIEEKTDEAPSIPTDRPITRPVVKEIYYLLADFYFKNKEFFKAIKFYMQDVCVCPDRLDSWAGMALARGGRLEYKLCESKTEGTIYKHSVAALRCFHRALQISQSNRSLWIEYGSMSYMLHSHASRQLKQKEQFSLTDDIIKFLQEKRRECLSLAERCFQEAIRCEVDGEEEEWLVHYMLGKIAEKRQKDPQQFLHHYKKAAFYLHEDEAKYPKKIAYHNPPDLSLEALEMYFRLHASILKLLEKPDVSFHGDYAMFRRFVLDAVDEPFVIAQEKTDTSEPQSSAENDPDTKSPLPSVKGQEVKLYKPRVPGSPLFIATPTDHDYLRSRNKKRQLSQEPTDVSPVALHLSQDDQISIFSELSSPSKDDGSPTMAAEILKSLAKIHTDSLDPGPSKKTKYSETVVASPDPQARVGPAGDTNRTSQAVTKDEVATATDAPSARESQRNTSIIVISSTESEDQMESDGDAKEAVDAVSKDAVARENSIIVISSEDSEGQMDVEEGLETDGKKTSTAAKPEIAKDKTDVEYDDGSMPVQEKSETGGEPEEPKEDADLKPKEGSRTDEGMKRTAERPDGKEVEMIIDGEQRIQSDDKDKDEEDGAGSLEEQRIWLIERCLGAMKLCLTRFPQHYKSLYRMANAYTVAPTHKNLQWSRDLLLGSVNPWQQTSHMPSPALFAEHWKTKNLFHGIWRIPVSEIDRSGSFSWHMYRSVGLLIDILKRLQDHAMLLQISIKLNRSPELGKRFLRDGDRQYLAKYCYKTCLLVQEQYVNEAVDATAEQQLQAVLSSYQLVQTAQNKLQTDLQIPTRLLIQAFRTYKDIKEESDMAVLEQATRFCFQHLYSSKTPQTPTSQPESIFSSPQPSKERAVFTPDRQSDTQGNTSSATPS